ncbi:MAG: glycosyltransferase [Anaerolineae bacterium]|jgi:glycosyltransferase involved in cell wall biosynthesis
MRILWTSPHCRPDWLDRLGEESQGGQTVVMNKLPHAMTRVHPDMHIDIFTRLQDNDPRAHHPVKHLDDDPRVRLIRLPCGPTDRYIPKEMLYGEPIAEFIRQILAFAESEGLRYELLHGHYADGWETVTALKTRWSHHPPALLTTHSLGRRKQEDGLERGEGTPEELDKRYRFPVRISSEERSLAVADRILPLSTPEAEYLFDNYEAVPRGDSRVTVVPNGIDPAQFAPAPPGTRVQRRKELGAADDEFLLLIPSRVDPRKGQENMLRALIEARSALHEHTYRLLLLAWPTPPTDYAIRLRGLIAEHNLGNCVITHPPVPHEDMPGFLAAADGVVLPSQEYFSIVMLEAMLLERPLIASVHGGSRDVIDDGVNGFLVDHNAIDQLAEATLRMLALDEAARRRMGGQANQSILAGYTWDRVAQRLLDIYLGE